ncbi:MAG: hypothetical protein V1909_01770, partial [Candidatus Micrarchaeota archaeon]
MTKTRFIRVFLFLTCLCVLSYPSSHYNPETNIPSIEIGDNKEKDCNGIVGDGTACPSDYTCQSGLCIVDANSQLYRQKLLEIEKINKEAKTWVAKPNKIFLLSDEDKNKLLGVISETPLPKQPPAGSPKYNYSFVIPPSFDWRNRHGFDYITPVRN